MAAPSFEILARSARPTRKSGSLETRLQFELLEERRMLTLVISGNGNTDAASLLSAGGPGSGMPGFANVGLSSTGNASVTYLGSSWVLTAGHVAIANVITGSPGGVTFGGIHYNVDESSITYLHNSDNSLADLKVFKMIGDPGLPSILPSRIDTTTATGRQIMIGNGLNLNLGNQQYWTVNTIDPNNWNWASEPQPVMPGPNDFSGFNITGSHAVRWGENDVVPDPNNPQQAFEQYVHTADDSQNNPLNIQGYFTQLDDSTYTGIAPRASEGQASSGDSGGAVFSLVNGQWQFSGVMIAVGLFNNQPSQTAVFGDATFIADLSQYRAQILENTSSVAARNLFYASSTRYDATGNPQTPLPFSDDNAIATDKSAYLPNGTAATFANVSSYDRGINGIMVDLLGVGTHTSITLANILNDFTFKVGNNNSPSIWAAAPNPTSVTVRLGAGVSGSDRVELVWPDNAIQQQWIEVIVKATANTGLAANDVFFFGNEIGCTGASNTATIAKVTSSDVTDTQTHGATLKANIPVTNIYDFNRDGQAGSPDVTDSQTHGTTNKTGLNFINIGAGGPFAPEPAATPVASSDAGVASALSSTSASAAAPAISAWIVNRVARVDPNRADSRGGPIVRYIGLEAHEGTAKFDSILVAADQTADSLNLDDTLLDALFVRLGLE